jgi:hypothetical protein
MGKGLQDRIAAGERGAAAQGEVGAGNAEREERAKQEEWMKYEEDPRRKQMGGGRVKEKGGGMDTGESMVGQPLQEPALPRKESEIPTGQPMHLRSTQICRALRTCCLPAHRY